MRNIFLRFFSTALLLGLASTVCFAGASRPKTMLRVHVQTTVQGAPGTQSLPVTIINPTRQIMVRALPEVTERDIDRVESTEADSGLALRITFNEHGRTVLNTVTLENQGKIMVVFLNGRAIYAPVIDKVIADGVLIIPRGVAPEEVPLLQDQVKENHRR